MGKRRHPPGWKRNARIVKITDALIRKYTNSGASKVYVSWVDENGERGTTEGNLKFASDWMKPHPGGVHRFGGHMRALLQRAKREGVRLRRERW